MGDAQEKMEETKEAMKGKVYEGYEAAKEKAKEAAGAAKEKLEATKEGVIGGAHKKEEL